MKRAVVSVRVVIVPGTIIVYPPLERATICRIILADDRQHAVLL